MSRSKTTNTSSSQLDPAMRDKFLQNTERATGVAERLGAREFAGFTPDQYESFEQTRQFADPNSQQMQQVNTAANIAQRAGTYRPQNVRSQGFSAARLNRGDVRDVEGGSILNQDMGAYMNPYTQNVTNQGLRDINRSRQIEQIRTSAGATAARAFGGSRQGVAEAETNRAYDENALRFVGDQNARAFQSAQQAAQTDLGRQMEAERANQAVDLSTGQLNTQNLQQARQYNAGNVMQANLANQAAGLQANQQRIGASGQLAGIAQQGQNMGFAGAQQLAQQGNVQQRFSQDQLDALRNLPLEQQQIINQSLGINVGGGSGMQSSSSGRGSSFSLG